MIWAMLWIAAERVALWIKFPLCAEDAYITFHAAIDPAWTHATTSPPWMLVLRLVSVVGVTPEAASHLILLAADLFAVYAASKYLKPIQFWVFVGFWSLPFFAASYLSGLETHLVACGLIAAPAFPWAAAVSALRLEAMLAWAVNRRWSWIGLGVGLAINVLVIQSILPLTVGSKASVYGVNWFSNPGWFHHEAFGWLGAGLLVSAFSSIPALCAGLVLAGYWAIGAPTAFWWYAVSPLALLSVEASRLCNRKWIAGIALVLVVASVPHQWERMTSRLNAEAALWDTGKAIAQRYQGGTMMLEPAGMIPYLNPGMKIVDEVGLVEPWVARVRHQGSGWMTDALNKYTPDLVLMRVKNVRDGGTGFSGSGAPFASPEEFQDFNYRYGVVGVGAVWGQISYVVRPQAHVLAVFRRR